MNRRFIVYDKKYEEGHTHDGKNAEWSCGCNRMIHVDLLRVVPDEGVCLVLGGNHWEGFMLAIERGPCDKGECIKSGLPFGEFEYPPSPGQKLPEPLALPDEILMEEF